MAQVGSENRELPLAPGSYAFMQDTTKGSVKTYVGPTVINQTGQERPVVYHGNAFVQCTLEQAVKPIVVAGEGDYVVLDNPSKKAGEQFPPRGGVAQDMELQYGTCVNIPGPTSFALWPGQVARVIPGHNLRSNQYVQVRVYNESQAKANWSKAVIKTADTPADEEVATKDADQLGLTMGKLLIIKGTEVSFYIPPTGVEVVPDSNGNMVQEAVTLERLEYCILIDEDGNKRYARGPAVVFPKPTENFFTENKKRKFRAVDLNEIQGLHIKVIAPYEEDGKKYKEGDEIFITGKECAIYYPRPEHSIVKYGEREKHYATAIPPGEGRYLMNRKTGVIELVRGPTMSLPNPVYQVFVRRILTESECTLLYPGNNEAMIYNRGLRSTNAASQGYVEEEAACLMAADYGATARGLEGMDYMKRSTQYTQPRMLTLDTKYEGVPTIQVWTGYAVMVVDKSSKRRVEIGPTTILLNYDESLEVLQLSTGKPKNTDKVERTVYLRTKNNKVSDIIDVETKDHVPISIKLSFRVNFLEEHKDKWFECENYVKLLCDHVRSMLKGMIRKLDVETFYGDGTAIIRDGILGPSVDGIRKGLSFEENGMVVNDVEVLAIEIKDTQVAQMLHETQRRAVQANIQANEAEKDLSLTKRKETVAREKAKEIWSTQELAIQLAINKSQKEADAVLESIGAQIKKQEQEKAKTAVEQATIDLRAKSELAREKARVDQEMEITTQQQTLELEKITADTNACVSRFQAAQSGFSEALLALGSQETMAKVYEAGSIQRYLGGDSFVDAITKIFAGTPMAEQVAKHTRRMGVSIPAPRD
jgi:major vault protein